MGCQMEDDEETLCIIRDFSGISQEWKLTLNIPSSMTVREFVREVARKFNYEPDSIELVSPAVKNPQITYTENNEELVKNTGVVSFQSGSRNLFVLEGLNNSTPRLVSKEDDLELGASASPEDYALYTEKNNIRSSQKDYGLYTENNNTPSSQLAITFPWKVSSSSSSRYITPDNSNMVLGFRGLVNQAMTCYLNSLLQALYMTPEFRNGIYNWKYDSKCRTSQSKSIPYQLQKLFLNLQTSSQSSVHTTELTRSFGWDSSEAWQQHDIQELCRVMFDALEHEFKGTEQADLINRLYGGKMMDYVKCLECGTEKVREDTFLDIPLPIRPFGSTVAYSSVEEALRGFVKPETLEGNNQYHCERCSKKCNAHKGFKFSKFPYLLTLHLMRFDFDYTTMHRVKLNDKLAFSAVMNLNSFISSPSSSFASLDKEDGSEGYPEEMTGNSSKCDDSSTTDSGSAIDDESCIASSNDLNADYEEVDEGIDVSNQYNEKNRKHRTEKGPYMYELFAIMVHSGSASGGHYYVLIKDLHSSEWYCFNDQLVTKVSQEDITRVYGGDPTRSSCYSCIFSGNNNAYMLMYRQIDKEKNALPMTEQEFPHHIKELMKNLEDKSETDLRIQDRENEKIKIKVYVQHPILKSIIDGKIDCTYSSTLKDVTQLTYNKLQLEDVVSLSRCRLVIYNSESSTIESSLEGKQNDSIGSILSFYSNTRKGEMLMDIRPENKDFHIYKPGSVMMLVYCVNLSSEKVYDPTVICGHLTYKVEELKTILCNTFNRPTSDFVYICMATPAGTYRFLDDDNVTLKASGCYSNTKLFVCFEEYKDGVKVLIRQIVEKRENALRLNVILPNSNVTSAPVADICKRPLLIPVGKCYTDNHNYSDDENTAWNKGDVPALNGSPSNSNLILPMLLSTPPLNADDPTMADAHNQLSNSGLIFHHSDQSTSEDSSLTDSDRTIIGDEQQYDCQMLSPDLSPHGSECRLSPVDNLFNKEEDWPHKFIDTNKDSYCYHKDNSSFMLQKSRPIYNSTINRNTPLKIEIDRRSTVEEFKKMLEPHIGVSAEYFRLYDDDQSRYEDNSMSSFEITDLSQLKDEDNVYVKLGKSGNLHGKVYLLDLQDSKLDIARYMFELNVDQLTLIGETKRKIIKELNRIQNISIPFERCRLCKKIDKAPGEVYPNNKMWKDVNLCNNWELYVQTLTFDEDPDDLKNQYWLLLKKFNISNGQTEPFTEVMVPRSTLKQLYTCISEISKIPEEHLCIGKEMNTLESWGKCINVNWQSLSFASQKICRISSILQDGRLIYYRDSRDDVEVTNSTSSSITVPSRRERSLKIHVGKPSI